jgi:HK97 family phage major capsid protein
MRTDNRDAKRSLLRVRNEAPTPGALQEAISAVNPAFAEFRTKNDAALAELRAGRDDVVRREELERINAAMTASQAAVDELNRRIATAGISADGGSVLTAEARAYCLAVNSYMRRGVAPPQQSGSVGSDPDGGYLVGETVEAGIDRVLGVLSIMRGLATVRSIGTPSYMKLRGLGGTTSGWVNETESRPETQGPQLGKMEFPVHELYAFPFATQTLLDDAESDIESWYADEVGIEFDEEEGAAFITGDGQGKPRGLIGGYTPIANAQFSNSSPRLGYIVTGVSGGFVEGGSPEQSAYDCLIDVQHALKQQIRGSAQWLMNDLTLARVRKVKDGEGNYIWQPSVQAGEPSQLLGKPVQTDDNMPDIAADSYSIAFGDFRRTYLVLDRAGVRVLRDPFTNKPYVGFYTTKRVGGGIQDFQATKLLKFGTA